MSDRSQSHDIWIVYDGECPFCSRYVTLYRIRELADRVHLVNARETHPIVEQIRQHGLDLDQGMVVRINRVLFHGAEAMNMLAILGSSSTLFNIINRTIFRHPHLARALYPLLVWGRRIMLRLRRHPLIREM